MNVRRLLVLVAALAALVAVAAPAQAATLKAPVADVSLPLFSVPSLGFVPPHFKISGAQALQVAEHAPALAAYHRTHHPMRWRVFTWALSHYEIFFGYKGVVVGDVLVGRDGHLMEVWIGPLANASYARGHYGANFDSPWVWAGFGAMFLLPLLFLRRRSWLDLLDLGALLSFGVSYALFDHRHLEAGVWLAYPPLLYLLGRLLARGRRAAARRRLDVGLPTWLLAGGLLLLVAGRVVLTLLPPVVIDVGYASAIGAYKILHGQSIYYASLGHPDTYGPIAYLAYVPFAAIWHVTGWGYTPAARAATITFDVLTIAGLVLLGRRLRGGRDGFRLGLTLAWLWAACPFTVLGLVKSTNDGLIALLAVILLLVLSSPLRRGLVIGLAAAAKFVPAILLPLGAVGLRDGRSGQERKTLAAFVITVGLSIALFLPAGGLREFYDHTLGFQLTRTDVFSPWALHPGLTPVKDLVEVLVAALGVGVAFFPRGRRSVAQVSALAGALTIAMQLTALHWFYLYIVWFVPFLLVAVLAGEPGTVSRTVADQPAESEQPAEAVRAPALAGG